MKAIPFPESNSTLGPPARTYSADVKSVEPLPIWTNGEQCVSCWRPSWRERLSILLFGRVWLALLSGHTQHPAYVDGSRSYFCTAGSNLLEGTWDPF